MASLEQVIVQLRFGLEQLSAKNAQHEFEHLCRHYARARICSNILPATGPVQAGGDQGRDFETFVSYLRGTAIAGSTFVGLVSDTPVAFACTLQKSGIGDKIKTDVQTILGGGTTVKSIHYFLGSDLPVSKRHEIQEWCQHEQGVLLDIHDAQAISENLAQRDTFWIASRYLEVPSDVFPRDLAVTEDKYEAALKHWREQTVDHQSYAQFNDIKASLRHATWRDEIKHDLPFWIDRIAQFATSHSPLRLRRKALYEVSVARLRGQGTLNGHESAAAEFFEFFPLDASLDELEDSVVLLSYCLTAQLSNQAGFTLTDLAKWHQHLVTHIENELQIRTFPSSIAILLNLGGMLAIYIVTNQGIDGDLEAQFEWWSKLADLLPEANLFPIESFSESLTRICDCAGDHPKFSEITAKVDQVLATRRGGFAAAAACRDRAMKHYEAGRVLMAISEIHKAKINWFAEETLEGCILTLLVLTNWYSKLGLLHAAKYHALAAATMSTRSGEHRVKARTWQALFLAADCDYQMAAFAGFLDLLALSGGLHQIFAVEPGNTDKHPELKGVIYHSAMTVYLTERLSPSYAGITLDRVNSLGIGELFEDTLELIRREWGKRSDSDLIASVLPQFGAIPVSDIGMHRRVTWNALGINWTVEWTNTYEVTAFAEQFIAILQIVQAELVGEDLCLPSAPVNVSFELFNGDNPLLEPLPSQDGFMWRLRWPSTIASNTLQEAFMSAFAAVMQLLGNASFRKHEEIVGLMERMFQNGVPAKTIIGQSYAHVYQEIVGEREFNDSRKVLAAPNDSGYQFVPPVKTELLQEAGSGPGYSKEESERIIKERYARTEELIPFTIQRLRSSPEFHKTCSELRAKGWKDWHILHSVFTAVANHRRRQQYGDTGDLDDIREQFAAVAFSTESETDDKFPLSELTAEKLEFYRQMNLGPILKNWGFELHHPAFTPSVVEDFLARRFGYWTDDVPHGNVLSEQ